MIFRNFRKLDLTYSLISLDLSGGAIADDFDNDGWIDIVTSTSDASGPMRFYKNNGDGTFADRSKESNLSKMLGGINLIQADFDNDGHLDLYVTRGAWWEDQGRHPNSLLRNLGWRRVSGCNVRGWIGITRISKFVRRLVRFR